MPLIIRVTHLSLLEPNPLEISVDQVRQRCRTKTEKAIYKAWKTAEIGKIKDTPDKKAKGKQDVAESSEEDEDDDEDEDEDDAADEEAEAETDDMELDVIPLPKHRHRFVFSSLLIS